MIVNAKICGLTTPEMVRAACDAGASAVGFVLSPSVRQISPEKAHDLAEVAFHSVKRVAVFKSLTPADLMKVQSLGGFTHIQADADDEDLVTRFAPGLNFIPVYRDLPLLRVHLADEETRAPRLILIEGAISGIGMLPDWGRVARAAATLSRPWMLAGGLTPENVSRAIQATGPSWVDVSSGVESAPGVKDAALIARFIQEASKGFKEHTLLNPRVPGQGSR